MNEDLSITPDLSKRSYVLIQRELPWRDKKQWTKITRLTWEESKTFF
jgi:hypothetical protein